MIAQMVGRLLVVLIRIYQGTVSSLLGPCCRFHPSCSEYTATAIAIHGPWKGIWLGLRRLCRCHPFHPGGVDPVPLAGEKERTRL